MSDTPQPRVEDLYQRILDEIYSGRFKPGQPIAETQFGKKIFIRQHRFGKEPFSQATARQALIKLEHLGLVKREPHKATTIASPDHDDFKNRIEVRIALESLACQSAAKNFDRQKFAQLEALFKRIGQSPHTDEEFHHFIWDLANNDLLVETLKQISKPMFAFIEILRMARLQQAEPRKLSHRALIEALQSSDSKRIQAVVRKHVTEAYEPFLASEFHDMGSVAASLEQGSQRLKRQRAVSIQRQFLDWLPATAKVRDAKGRVRFANREPQRSSSEQNLTSLTYDRMVLQEKCPLLTIEGAPQHQRMIIRFPMLELLIGELGLDIEPIRRINESRRAGRVRLNPVETLEGGMREEEPAALLLEFFRALPAIATWKDLQGRMVWANKEYERFTGKLRDTAIGQLPTGNWDEDQGKMIMIQDTIVRRTKAAHLSANQLIVKGEPQWRLTIRFPIFGDSELAMTGTLGLSYDIAREALKLLKQKGHDHHYRLPGLDRLSDADR